MGAYFHRNGVISPTKENIAAAFVAGHNVILWPGGEVDFFRAWRKRDQVVLGDRKGFIRLAIRERVPIVPVATIGGHDTFFVLSEGRGIAKALGLKKYFRTARIFSFSQRRQVCEHAYQTTRAELWNRRADIEPLLARYGITLRKDVLTDQDRHFDSHLRIPPEVTRLAKRQHPATNDLSDRLDRLEAWLQEHSSRTADTD